MKEKERCYLVVKSNDLIQKTRYSLTLPEQKTIAYICSMIEPNSDKMEFIFDIREYAKICGFDYENGKNYMNIKATLKKLADISMWLEIGDEEVLVRWLSKVKTNKKSGKAFIQIDEDLMPYLVNLKERFTQYEIYNILAMKSGFSLRIYELLKSYQKLGKKKFAIDDLKEKLMVQDVKSYDNFKDFRRKVIEVAVEEINELTDLQITWEPERKGRKIVAITFHIGEKNGWDSLKAKAKTQAKIDKIEV